MLARQNAEVELSPFDAEIQVDEEFHQAIASAWEQELSLTHVSQGAYVSRAQYEEAAGLTPVVGWSSRSGQRDVAASIFPRRRGRTTNSPAPSTNGHRSNVDHALGGGGTL